MSSYIRKLLPISPVQMATNSSGDIVVTVLCNPSGEASSTQIVLGNDTRFSTFTSTTAGLVPASAGGTTNFLRADGAFAAPAGGGGGSSIAAIVFQDSSGGAYTAYADDVAVIYDAVETD